MSAPDRIAEDRPVLGVCGYSGSGKTTLVEALIPPLIARGLAVAVVKHDAHGMRLDAAGKDTDRFFRAGATVVGRDPDQEFLRGRRSDTPLAQRIESLLRTHDLVLVEGHKRTPLPARVWLESLEADTPPDDAGAFEFSLARDADRVGAMLAWIDTWLPALQRHRPLRAGLLIGGHSRRMGTAKQLLEHEGRCWSARVADALRAAADPPVLLGAGPVPDELADLVRLPDAPGCAGPIAGLIAALRWDPTADWVFAACDMPLLEPAGIDWLLAQRAPGRWAVIPRHARGACEPLAAWYDARMLEVLTRLDRPVAAADHAKAHTPELTDELAPTWRSFNIPGEIEDLR